LCRLGLLCDRKAAQLQGAARTPSESSCLVAIASYSLTEDPSLETKHSGSLEDRVTKLIQAADLQNAHLGVSLVNTLNQVVVSGTPGGVASFCTYLDTLKQTDLIHTRLNVVAPFHNPLLSSVVDECRSIHQSNAMFSRNRLQLPVYSPVDGIILTEAAVGDDLLGFLVRAIAVLPVHWDQVCSKVPAGSTIIDFGPGCSRQSIAASTLVNTRSAGCKLVGFLEDASNPCSEQPADGNQALLQSDEDFAQHYLTRLFNHKFDLAKGPLVVARLVVLSKTRHFFAVCLHHIVFDGWSHFLLYNDLWRAYKGGDSSTKLSRLPSQLSPLWQLHQQQAEWLLSPAAEASRAHWKSLMSGATHCYIPGDLARPAQFSFLGRKLTRSLDAALMTRVSQFTASHQVTLFQALVATLACVVR